MKRCNKCGETKPRSEFYAAAGCRDGLRGDCRACFATRARERYKDPEKRRIAIERAKQWRKDNLDRARASRRARYAQTKDRARDQHLRRTFGMSTADYEAMLAAQGGVCAICLEPPNDGESLHVDHLDDRVRGILCVRCNNALGQLREDVEIAERAVDYLASDGFVRTGEYDVHAMAITRARELVSAPG
jgi:hypothetical protein